MTHAGTQSCRIYLVARNLSRQFLMSRPVYPACWSTRYNQHLHHQIGQAQHNTAHSQRSLSVQAATCRSQRRKSPICAPAQCRSSSTLTWSVSVLQAEFKPDSRPPECLLISQEVEEVQEVAAGPSRSSVGPSDADELRTGVVQADERCFTCTLEELVCPFIHAFRCSLCVDHRTDTCSSTSYQTA